MGKRDHYSKLCGHWPPKKAYANSELKANLFTRRIRTLCFMTIWFGKTQCGLTRPFKEYGILPPKLPL